MKEPANVNAEVGAGEVDKTPSRTSTCGQKRSLGHSLPEFYAARPEDPFGRRICGE